MGKRGPRKKPAATHKRQGTFQPCRHAGVELPPGLPEPPADLCERERAHWISIGRELLEAGLVSELDALALRLFVESIELYLSAQKEIAEWGLVLVSDKGNHLQNPAVGIRTRAWAQVVKLCQEFGMTPSARTGLKLEKPPAGDEKMSQILGFKVIG